MFQPIQKAFIKFYFRFPSSWRKLLQDLLNQDLKVSSCNVTFLISDFHLKKDVTHFEKEKLVSNFVSEATSPIKWFSTLSLYFGLFLRQRKGTLAYKSSDLTRVILNLKAPNSSRDFCGFPSW